MTIDFDCSQPAIPDPSATSSSYQRAEFRFWTDEGAGLLKGLLVMVPGWNGDGRGMVDDSLWQAFAREHRLGMVGCWYTDYPHEQMNIERYVQASAGSGLALLDAIAYFAQQTGHGELESVPLLLWGHSAGGQFNYEFACWRPERVAAFVVNKGGFYYTHLASPACRQVPGLLLIGQQDAEFRRWSVRGIFAVNRQVGARWALAEEPGVGHELGATPELARAFFTGVLRERQAGSQPAAAWLGDLDSGKVYPAPSETTLGNLTAWLPNESVAQVWQKFVRGPCSRG